MDSLIGRDFELQVLQNALVDAHAGQPRIVVLQGQPGIGKTALLNAFVPAAADAGWLRRVTCDRSEQDIAFGALSLVLGEVPDPTTSVVAVASRLLRWFGEQQQSGPGALVIDDAQWMDPQSIATLRFGLRRLRADRVCTVLARRPPSGDDPLASLYVDPARSTVLDLAPLTVSEVGALAYRERSWDLSAEAARRLVEHTGGVPLLLLTLVREAPAGSLDADAVLPVPASTTEAVGRVLVTLDLDARRLLQALAVLDEPTALIPLGSVAGVDPTHAIVAARETRLVEVDRRSGHETVVRFAHGLLRDAAYESLDAAVRRELHGRAALVTTAGRRLTHEVAATDRPDRDLAARLLGAAEDEARRGHGGVAAARLLQARAVTDEPPVRDELLVRALLAYVRGGNVPAAEALRDGVEATPSSVLRSHALGVLARETGRIPAAREHLEEAVTAADIAGLAEAAEVASVDLAALHALLNNGPATVQAASRGLNCADRDVARAALAYHAAGLWTAGQLPDALPELEGVPTVATATPADADLLFMRGLLSYFGGSLRPAAEDLGGAIRLGSTFRRAYSLARAYVQRSTVRFALGDWDGAAVDASNACAIADDGDRPWDAPIAHAVSVHVPAARGEWAVAEEHLTSARAAFARIGSMHAAALVAAAAAQLSATREDFAGVLREIAPLLEPGPLQARTAMRATRWLFIAAVEAYVRLGRLDEARETLSRFEEALAVAPQGPGPTRLGWLRGTISEACGDLAAARTAYATDAADPAYADAPFERAALQFTAGRLERAAGNRREAIELLRGARRTLADLRAMPYLARCDAELTACGLQQTQQDPLALTAREQDVASLVARGLTNAEVAAELYLTPKTIEYHMGNIFAKLGISKRSELRVRLLAPAH